MGIIYNLGGKGTKNFRYVQIFYLKMTILPQNDK